MTIWLRARFIHAALRREKQQRSSDRMPAHRFGLAELVTIQVGANDFEQATRGRTRRKEADVLAVSAH